MMKQTPKIWGSTCKLFDLNNVEVHRIEVKAGGYCSEHSHKYKHNLFYVESGELHIRTWLANGKAIENCLLAGDILSVRPGVVHRFEGRELTVAYEIYWAELGEDIIRLKPGGLKATAHTDGELSAAMKEIGAIMEGKVKI